MERESATEIRRLVETLEGITQSEEAAFDEAIQSAGSVDELVTRIRQATTQDNEAPETEMDARVREANSVEDLVDQFEAVDEQGAEDDEKSIEGRLSLPVPKPAKRAEERTKGKLASGRESLQSFTSNAKEKIVSDFDLSAGRIEQSVGELKYTLRNADPKESAMWGIGVGLMLAQPAVAAGYSTAALLSGAVLSGTAVGAYTSSHEGTRFDEIDPIEMAYEARLGAMSGRRLNATSGGAIGALVASAMYVAQNATPAEYEQWVEEADVEYVLEGAIMGAERFDAPDGRLSVTGAGIGGGFGLLYGYADGESVVTDFPSADVLDDDLLAAYRRRIEGDRCGTDIR